MTGAPGLGLRRPRATLAERARVADESPPRRRDRVDLVPRPQAAWLLAAAHGDSFTSVDKPVAIESGEAPRPSGSPGQPGQSL